MRGVGGPAPQMMVPGGRGAGGPAVSAPPQMRPQVCNGTELLQSTVALI